MKTLEFKLTLTLAQQQTIDLWLDQMRWIWNEGLALLEEDQQRRWREKNPLEEDIEAVAWHWHRNSDGSFGLACECAIYNRKTEALYPVCRLRTKRDAIDPGKNYWKLGTNKKTSDQIWLHDICSRARNGVIDSLKNAWRAYKKPKHPGRKPQYKGKRDKIRSLTNKNGDATVNFSRIGDSDNAYIKYPKLGCAVVKGFYKRYQGQKYNVVRILKESSDYYLQIVCETEEEQLKPSDKAVGLDLGLKSVFTTNSGKSVAPPRLYRQKQKRLRKLQRKASRQVKSSNSQKKTYRQIGKLHEKIRRSRNAFNHKLSTSLVREFGAIAIEDLQIKNLVRRPKPKKREDGKGYERNGAKRKSGLNKSFADTGLGDLKAKIESKAKAGGRELALVPPHYTTIDCSRCGEKVRKALSTRTHRCSSCSLVLDRDENAARNILMKANFTGIYRTLVREVKPLKDREKRSVQAEAALAAPEDKYSSQSLIEQERGRVDVDSPLLVLLSGNWDGITLSSFEEATTIRAPDGERLSAHSGRRERKRKLTKASTSAQSTSETFTQLNLWDAAPETG